MNAQGHSTSNSLAASASAASPAAGLVVPVPPSTGDGKARQIGGTTSKGPVDRSFFERLSIIRLPLILLVIFHHNETGGKFIEKIGPGSFWGEVIEWLANGLAGVRMPVFFMIAGFVLFFNFQPEGSWFVKKIKSRTRTILLPLVLWTSLTLALFAIVQSIPMFSKFFSGNSIWSRPLADMTLLQFWNAFFGADDQMYLYPLWFLRDLFFLVLLSPVIWWLIQSSKGWATLGLLGLWFVDVDHAVLRDSWVFFAIGAHLAIFKRSIFFADRVGLVSLLLWLGLQVLHSQDLTLYALKVKTLLGVVGILYLSGWVIKNAMVSDKLKQWSKYSFFFFVAHEPLLTLTRKVYMRVVDPASTLAYVGAYFLVIAIVVGVLVVVFKIAERTMPRVLDVMTGGRA